MLYAMVKCSIKCPKCDSPVMLNGPMEVAHCDRCQNDISIPHKFWKGILEDILKEVRRELKEGEGHNSTIFGMFNTLLTYANLQPECKKCGTPIEIDKNVTESFTYVCPKCQHKTEIVTCPPWLGEIFPSIKLLVNAELQARTEKEPPAVSGPIVFSCPKCGAALTVDGTDRLVPCQFCGVNVYLPDDLWLRLHPAKTKNKWFIGFE